MSVGVSRFCHVTTTPDVITRYYAASAAGDLDALIGCFTTDAHVVDEGHDYHTASLMLPSEPGEPWRQGCVGLLLEIDQKLAQQRVEGSSLVLGQGCEQPRLVGDVHRQRGVDRLAAVWG
jgi:hypothetical protein